MSLLKDFHDLGTEKTYDFAKGPIKGLRSDPAFASLAAEVDILEERNKALKASILPATERTSFTDDVMMANKASVVEQLDLLRKSANDICNGDESLERLSGFTPSKRTRTKRDFIASAILAGAVPTGTKGQLLLTLKATVPGNTGYEVHYVLDGKDYIAGIIKIKSRKLTLLASNFPSLKTIEVYVITLSTHNLQSLPSNSITTAAS